MHHALLDVSQVVGTVEINGASHEICAEALANHDRRNELLTVTLRAFLRSLDPDHLGETVTPAWLPEEEIVTESASTDEARDMAGDIFASWCRRVAELIPEDGV